MSEPNVNSSNAGDQDPIEHEEYNPLDHDDDDPIDHGDDDPIDHDEFHHPDVRTLVRKSLQEIPGISLRQVLWLSRYACS